MILLLTLGSVFLLTSVAGQQWHDFRHRFIDNSESTFTKEGHIAERKDVAANDGNKPIGPPCKNRRANDYESQWVSEEEPSALKWRAVLPIEGRKDVPLASKSYASIISEKSYNHDEPEQLYKSTSDNRQGDPDFYANNLMSFLSDPPSKVQSYLTEDSYSPEKDKSSKIVPKVSKDSANTPCNKTKDTTCLLQKDDFSRASQEITKKLEGEPCPVGISLQSGRRFLTPDAREELALKRHSSLANTNKNNKKANELIIPETVTNRTTGKIGTEEQRNASQIRPNERMFPANQRIYVVNPKSLLTDKNQLLEPTRGIGIVPLSNTRLRTLENSRVCYACSTRSDETCWKPDRKTTVKYCRQGRDSCVTRLYNHSLDASMVVIRDCSSTCESVPIGDMKYLSCSICQGDLCNSHEVYNNSSSIKQLNIILIWVVIASVKYVL